VWYVLAEGVRFRGRCLCISCEMIFPKSMLWMTKGGERYSALRYVGWQAAWRLCSDEMV
jgi:hypothetical protein